MHELPPDATRLQAQIEHATGQAAFYRAMRERLEADRRNLRYVPLVGCALAAVVYAGWHLATLALGVAGVGVGTWVMGLYFVSVRATEYSYKLADANAELNESRGQLAALRAEAAATRRP